MIALGSGSGWDGRLFGRGCPRGQFVTDLLGKSLIMIALGSGQDSEWGVHTDLDSVPGSESSGAGQQKFGLQYVTNCLSVHTDVDIPVDSC